MTNRSPHLRRAFAFRAGYLALAWGACLGGVLLSPGTGAFAALIAILAWVIPVAAPVLLWLDWRWLAANREAVNRWGLKRR